MKLPEIAHGQEHTGVTHLAPDIQEQVELASRIGYFLEAIYTSDIQPSLKTRQFKDYRSKQPNGKAHISVAYSSEQEGRYSAEVHANHTPSLLQSHYNLLADGGHWVRNNSGPGRQSQSTILSPEAMLEDMLEYAPEDGETSKLLDAVVNTKGLVSALFTDMSRGAHFKSGSDHYTATVRTISEDGYVLARNIELVDARINNRVERRLAVTALTNIGAGPVDVTQELAYGVKLDNKGSIKSDGIQLIHKSSDGLSPQALIGLAEGSDIIAKRIDILHTALDDLSREVLLLGGNN